MRCPRVSWTCPPAAVLSILLLTALSRNASCQTQEKANVLPETQAGREIMVELQELGPVERVRQIHTANLDLLFRIRSFDTPDFTFYGGFTVSRSRGNLTRRTGSFEAGRPQSAIQRSRRGCAIPGGFLTAFMRRRASSHSLPSTRRHKARVASMWSRTSSAGTRAYFAPFRRSRCCRRRYTR